jgi:hypothetical protein
LGIPDILPLRVEFENRVRQAGRGREASVITPRFSSVGRKIGNIAGIFNPD